MRNGIPNISPEERTSLVQLLLDIVQAQHDEIARLRDEIAILKGQKPRPKIEPSRLEQPAKDKPVADEGQKQQRPGSDKRSKNAELKITHEVTVRVPDPPAGSVRKDFEEFIVQELVLETKVTRYLRERIVTPAGRTLVAPLPAEVVPGSHYGPLLIGFVLYQYHHNHVTQPLLLEQLGELGIDISSGQLSRILTEKKDVFHREKEELLPAGLASASFIHVDDTGARHQGKNGYCTHIGNDFFAYFASTDSKSRLNFLNVLRGSCTEVTLNEVAAAYWERQELPVTLIAALGDGRQHFADAAAWQARLQELGITGDRHVRIATEGALLGSLIAHGVSPHLVVLSDGAWQFNILVHAACWIHAERPLARMIPSSDEHRATIEKMRGEIWRLYQDLKAYRQQPDPERKPALQARFDALVEQRTGFPSINGVLKDMRQHRADLLCVLDRPEVPLHNNNSESDIRDYVKKRKISGSTRSEDGRRCRDTFASLKKTCRKLGVRFWQYLQDRIRGLGQVPRLADLLRQNATEGQSSAATIVP